MSSLRKIWEEGLNDARERDLARVAACQNEWLAFKCCDRGRILAVPIGCNHKLCAVCAAHRAEKYRSRVRSLFDRLQNPWFLTLTVPNCRHLSKRTYGNIRRATRKLLKIYEPWVKGGAYSLETTWNRKEQTWHVHVHVLLDAAFAPPSRRAAFIQFKRQIEFEWLRLTGGRAWAPADFPLWFANTEQPMPAAWNRVHRRVVDVRPVRDREGAAYEIFKYITKVSDFVDDFIAVEAFLRGSRGVRMLQTFGSWYGFKFELPEKPTAGLRCTADCQESHWQHVGRFYREYIESLPGRVYALRKGVIRRE